VGGEKTGFALPLQREGDIRRIEDRLVEEDKARPARDADVASLVEVHFPRANEPVVVARTAGRVACLLHPVEIGALEEESLGRAASLQRLFGRPARDRIGNRERRRIGRFVVWRLGAQQERRLLEETALGAEIDAQVVAFEDVSAVVRAHVAFRLEDVQLRFVTHPVGGERLSEAAKAHVAFRFGRLVSVTAQRVRFHEHGRRLVAHGRQREEEPLGFELDAFFRRGRDRQDADESERDTRCSCYRHRGSEA
jgi:hypothetical protein